MKTLMLRTASALFATAMLAATPLAAAPTSAAKAIPPLMQALSQYQQAEETTKTNLKTFDELDFDVYSHQKWDRLHESHAQDILVHYPDGSTTKGIKAHIAELKKMFVFAPDTHIAVHPVRFGNGEWTGVIGVIAGTFSKPMPIGGGKAIAPTGKPYKLTMATIGHWTKQGVMDEEYLFWDNLAFMKQIGLAQ